MPLDESDVISLMLALLAIDLPNCVAIIVRALRLMRAWPDGPGAANEPDWQK